MLLLLHIFEEASACLKNAEVCMYLKGAEQCKQHAFALAAWFALIELTSIDGHARISSNAEGCSQHAFVSAARFALIALTSTNGHAYT